MCFHLDFVGAKANDAASLMPDDLEYSHPELNYGAGRVIGEGG